MKKPYLFLLSVIFVLSACNKNKTESKDEEISICSEIAPNDPDSILYSLLAKNESDKLSTWPSSVVLTGLNNQRLLTIYRSQNNKLNFSERLKHYNEDEAIESEHIEHFMPGLDILYGYNLLNIAHYNIQSSKLSLFFNKPVLVKTLYFPSYRQDSLNGKPINRNFFLVSAYDDDTNKDSLINKFDLRHFYIIDEINSLKTSALPLNYSVFKSQYDSGNDFMYLFAKHDANNNGKKDSTEPIHVFRMDLKAPAPAIRMY